MGANGAGSPVQLDALGFFGAYSNNEMYVDNFWFGDSPVSVKNEGNTPTTFSLSQNYPNPFNPATTVDYSIQSVGLVTLKVFDILGKEVASLVNETKEPENYSVTFNVSDLPSGIYIYTLTNNNLSSSKKLILLK